MENRRLNIGLPVYNGEKYIEEALDSILGQTYSDFDLIISDNASTDGTEDICRSLAAKDQRIQYFRNPKNIGATQNWYHVFDLSCSEYFASAAHDDLYAPNYMKKCISILDQDPSVVVCYSKTRIIDDEGGIIKEGTVPQCFEAPINTMSNSPSSRLYNVINVDYWCIQLYGVMRSDALRKTRYFAGYYACDRNTLAELSLLGKIWEFPDYLFYHRIYQKALGGGKKSGRSLQELFQFDPGTDWNSRFSKFKVFANYFGSVARASISSKEKILCYLQLQRIILGKLTGRILRTARQS